MLTEYDMNKEFNASQIIPSLNKFKVVLMIPDNTIVEQISCSYLCS